jgi:hypothetical protein
MFLQLGRFSYPIKIKKTKVKVKNFIYPKLLNGRWEGHDLGRGSLEQQILV